jgi:hypothetical protein
MSIVQCCGSTVQQFSSVCVFRIVVGIIIIIITIIIIIIIFALLLTMLHLAINH